MTLPSSSGHGEPSIEVAADGTVYVVAPFSRTSVWRSDDGGNTFVRKPDSLGSSGDSDVETDANGRLYVSDLFSNVPVSVSTNKGNSYTTVVSTSPGGNLDRQWLAAYGNGKAWSTWRDGSAEKVARTTNGGLTWSAPVTVATGVTFRGNILATSETNLWIPYTEGVTLKLAKSTDGGVTWTSSLVAVGASDTVLFPGVAVDANGKVYVAWAQGTGTVDRFTYVKVARSDDGGATFGAPLALSNPYNYNLFPWIVAGAGGRVAIAWYEGVPPVNATSDPNAATLTQWRVRVAHSIDADTAAPSYEAAYATAVFHTGPICTMGISCFPVSNPVAFNRMLLDFFEIAIQPDGRLIIAYAADGGVANAGTASVLKVVQQTAGNLLI